MRLGLTNRIVKDSDFKAVDFHRRLRSDSKSNDESESTIAISIWIRYKIDLFRHKINLFRFKFDLFQLKDQKRPSKFQLINWKQQIISKPTIYIENDDQNDHFWSNWPIFDINPTIFDLNGTTFDINGPDSNRRDNCDGFRQQLRIVKVDSKTIRIRFQTKSGSKSIRSH